MLTHFYITQRGRLHIERETECQDSSFSLRIHSNHLSKDFIISAIADGVGSCEFSQYGSKKAVASFCGFISDKLLDKNFVFKDDNILLLIEKGFSYSLNKVEELAEQMELPFLEFDSTLTVSIYDGKNIWYGHVGDDGIVVLYEDGTYEMITTRHKGDDSNSVFPLRNNDLWQFGKTIKPVVSFVMMTDGVLNYCVDSEVMNNRIYFPFLEPALTSVMVDDKDSKKQKSDWEEYLSGNGDYKDNFRDAVSDDITFVVIQNSKEIKKLPEIEFDFEKWNSDTAKRKKELDENLFADFKKYKEGKDIIRETDVIKKQENIDIKINDDSLTNETNTKISKNSGSIILKAIFDTAIDTANMAFKAGQVLSSNIGEKERYESARNNKVDKLAKNYKYKNDIENSSTSNETSQNHKLDKYC